MRGSDGEHMAFREWGTQGQLSLMDKSLSYDGILERSTQGQLSLRDMSLITDKILEPFWVGVFSKYMECSKGHVPDCTFLGWWIFKIYGVQ